MESLKELINQLADLTSDQNLSIFYKIGEQGDVILLKMMALGMRMPIQL